VPCPSHSSRFYHLHYKYRLSIVMRGRKVMNYKNTIDLVMFIITECPNYFYTSIIQRVQKVAVHLQKVLEVMSMNVQ
jgi:hypothetical protein